MINKAKVAVCAEIPEKKTLNARRVPCRIFEMLNLVVRKETARL